MSRISNPFRYSFDAPYQSVQCVFKMWFGTRYFIWKTKSLHSLVNKVSIELDRKLRLGFEKDNFYAPILRYIRSGRIGLFRVEMIKATDDPTELLLTEFKALQAAKDDKKCLNNIFEPQVPQWVPVESKQALEEAVVASKKKVKKKIANGKKVKSKPAIKTKAAINVKARLAGRSSRK